MFLLPILQDAKEERVKIEIVLSQGDGVMRSKLHDFGMQGTAAAAGRTAEKPGKSAGRSRYTSFSTQNCSKGT